jgi:hypothetical protein
MFLLILNSTRPLCCFIRMHGYSTCKLVQLDMKPSEIVPVILNLYNHWMWATPRELFVTLEYRGIKKISFARLDKNVLWLLFSLHSITCLLLFCMILSVTLFSSLSFSLSLHGWADLASYHVVSCPMERLHVTKPEGRLCIDY